MDLVISFELDGVHYWPDAPDECREFREVHRHLFKFIVWAPESRSRAIELFAARRALMEWTTRLYPASGLEAGGVDFGPSSCEDIAANLKKTWNARRVFVGEEWFLGAET